MVDKLVYITGFEWLVPGNFQMYP